MHFCYNLILQTFFYKFRFMKVNHQEVSCRINAFWYDVMSKYVRYYGEYSVYRMEQNTAVEPLLWLGQWVPY